jgi:hypothetical protein
MHTCDYSGEVDVAINVEFDGNVDVNVVVHVDVDVDVDVDLAVDVDVDVDDDVDVDEDVGSGCGSFDIFAHLFVVSVRYICFNIFLLFIISVPYDKLCISHFKRNMQVNVDVDISGCVFLSVCFFFVSFQYFLLLIVAFRNFSLLNSSFRLLNLMPRIDAKNMRSAPFLCSKAKLFSQPYCNFSLQIETCGFPVDKSYLFITLGFA